jgi:3-methyladenine DNA glycosylase/8-oxoguanine DNA glycosylase
MRAEACHDDAVVETTIRLRAPLDLRLTLAPLHRGGADPTMRVRADGVWRATRTPEGPATVHLAMAAARTEVRVRAWGPGAAWAVAAVPDLVGLGDDAAAAGFRPGHPLVADAHRRHPGLRVCRSNAVLEVLVPTIIEQKVVSIDARQAYTRLAWLSGERAPGPAVGPAVGPAPSLLLPPDPAWLQRLPSWEYHRCNLERKRADTVRRACSYAHRLEELTAMDAAAAEPRLTVLPGIGPWSSAKVREAALGDPDAVAVGDYHLPNLVSWSLAGERRGTDERMLELLEPWAESGQRGRVVRLLTLGGSMPSRRAPRMPRQSIVAI